MSIILDALNRSESDRKEEQDVPGLHTVHGTGDAVPEPLWKRLLWPALALGFAALAAFGWWSAQRPLETPAPTVSPPVESAGATRPASPGSAVPEPPQEQADSADRAARADIAALYESATAEPVQQPARKPVQTATATPAREPAPAEASEPEIDVDVLAEAARAELEELQTDSEPVVQHSAPFIAELRQSQKDQIPSIFYRAHNWSSDPRERSVVLNKQEFREGQQVKPGLRLVEILQDSIVLDFQGTEFRLRSLNSWVNL